ncbi:MAG TPA: hypothetical protein VKP69_02295, partial [Isosphaeraceae bacterium]|nr:hypothetical protein [Isosphaeraceae bacterium]
MSLLNLPIGHGRRSSVRCRAKAFRPALQPYLEGLEQRTVLSTATAAAAVVAPPVMLSPVQITSATLNNLTVTGANTLTGTLNLAGNLITKAGSTPFALPGLQVPITLIPGGQTADGCPILHLSLQIPDLNLLGLHVQLDNCNNGPVTVDITAIHSGSPGGGLLGDLLCSVSNLLNSNGGLLNLNGQTSAVTGALSQVFNGGTTTTGTHVPGILDQLLAPGSGGGDQAPAGTCELVNLHLGPIHLNVLGLDVQTSQICLLVYADPNGGLLGDLLCSLDNLLNN